MSQSKRITSQVRNHEKRIIVINDEATSGCENSIIVHGRRDRRIQSNMNRAQERIHGGRQDTRRKTQDMRIVEFSGGTTEVHQTEGRQAH